MNFKERGMTVGDLLIISIIVFSTLLIFSKIKNNNEKSYFYITPIQNLIAKKTYLC